MKLTFAAVAAVAICLFSLAARSTAMRAAARSTPPEKAYLEEERLALDAIDGRLRGKLQRLAIR